MSGLQMRVETQPVLFSKVWQQPYVNVFKQVGVYDGHHSKVQGDIKTILDPTLNKQVLCIKGSISAANFIELPGPGATHRERTRNPAAAKITALGLTGEYMYIQLRAMADRYFSIHIDVLTTQGLTIRLSISNIFKYIKLMNHGRVLQLPCDFLSTKWTVLALHFPSLLEECSNNVQSMNAFVINQNAETGAPMPALIPNIKYVFSSVQRIQFCSSLYVKNVITSSHKYTINTFPKDVKFFVGKGYSFDDFYEWFWIITPPTKQQQVELAQKREEESIHFDGGDVDREEMVKEMERAALESVGESKEVATEQIRSQPFTPEQSQSHQRLFDTATGGSAAASSNARKEFTSPLKSSVPVNVLPFVANVTGPAAKPFIPPIPITPASKPNADQATANLEVGLSAAEQASLARHQPLTTAEFDDPNANSVDVAPVADSIAQQAEKIKQRLKEETKSSFDQEEGDVLSSTDSTLHPDPIMTLEKIIGYTPSRTSKNICWSQDGQYMIYSSNNIVIISNVKTGEQEFLQGHTSTINLVQLSSNGILATGQEGKQAVIRLWNFQTRTCIGILLAHNSDLRCLAFSYLNLMLAAVGRDNQGRILIVIWDISAILETGKIHIVAKQLSDFGINKLVFSPFREDPLHLISCGHESIRFWRIKTKHCPGSSLALNEHARNTFTDLAFEAKYGEADQTTKRMFVSTASGSLFQINYATRQLECIYKLHSGPIYSISVNEGFCVTGSGDSFLRVWPLDFSDFYLQAQHKGAITAVQISTDGVHVLVGSENGCIGILDLGSTAYQTRIRSHLDTIYCIAFDPHRDEFATVSKDGTIRIFGMYSLEQIYEFYSPNEVIHCVAYHPLASEYRIACGFGSGSMRVMDIATTTMHVDYQQHQGRVLDLTFSADGYFLYSNGEDGNICAYDVRKNYLPVRMFTTYRHQPVPLPPSVSRTAQAESERQALQGKLSARLKEDHDSRSPFLSHHLERALKEEKEALNPSAKQAAHSTSHARHCDAISPEVGGPVLPHSHTSRTHQPPPILPPHALAINEDGSLLATIGADPTSIVLLSTDTLRQIRLFTTGSAAVARIQFVQHSRELCVVLVDQSWQRFSVETGNLLAHIHETPSLRFKQGRVNAAGSQLHNRTFGTHEINLGGLAFAAAATGSPNISTSTAIVTAAAVSPLNLWLLTGSNESLLRIWDFHSKVHAPIFQNFIAHTNTAQPQEGITCIAFSPDGKKLITTGGDSIWIWHLKANEKESLDALKRRVNQRQLANDNITASLPTLATHNGATLTLGPQPDPIENDAENHDFQPNSQPSLTASRPTAPFSSTSSFSSNAPHLQSQIEPVTLSTSTTREALF